MMQAKTVVKDQFWIVRDNQRKVGEVQALEQGYKIRIRDQVYHSASLNSLQEYIPIRFESHAHTLKLKPKTVYGYDVGCEAYNMIWDVRKGIPLFTKDKKSKSWFAAGWYAVKQNRTWRITRNPKSILLNRYAWRGPFHTQKDAQVQSIT